jgi:concentrative nucleoside transporter, CNT family
MKLSFRSGLSVLWLVAAVLLVAGVHATRTSTLAAQTAPSVTDTAGAQQPNAMPAIEPSGPPASDGGPAQPALDIAGAASPTAQAAERRPLRPVVDLDTPLHQRLISVLGMAVLLGIGWLLSVNRTRIPWRVVIWGMGLQIVFALIILRSPLGRRIFDGLNDIVIALLGFTQEGSRFLFGNLAESNIPVGYGEPGVPGFEAIAGTVANTGAFFAFTVLPTIVFFSSLMTLLYYLGVMQFVVKGFAWIMMRTMRTSGAETLSAAGNIFVGQTEAPLLIKPYVAGMTMSELMAVMTGGFATVAGGVMAAYVALLIAFFPDIAGHLMAASVMSAPAALVFAKMMWPETEEPATRGTLHVDVEKVDANVIDAAARGAGEGMHLALNVGAMLLAFIAIVALLNALLGWFGDVTYLAAGLHNLGALPVDQQVNLEWILGWLLAPLAWVMGVPWSDARVVGSLMGIKTAVNEFVAYLQFNTLLAGGTELSPRSIVIATYALCGFANFSSIAIQIGGIGGIAPSRRSDLARIGLRAMIAGTLAAFMTATIAGILV